MDQGVTLKEMSGALGVSPAFLSSIETGRKSIPQGLVEKTVQYLELDLDERGALEMAAEQSKREFKINMPMGTAPGDREIAAMFARQFPEMSEEQKEKLRALLEGRHA